jgi:hypothetical protein
MVAEVPHERGLVPVISRGWELKSGSGGWEGLTHYECIVADPG